MTDLAGRQPDFRIRKTRAALAGAVVALVTEKPYADVTIGEIAERAGIGYATFFRHYPDKAALLADVAGALVTELTAIIAPALRAQDNAGAALAICAFVRERWTLCRALLGGGASDAFSDFVLDRVISQDLPKDVNFARDLPAELAAGHATIVVMYVLRWWLKQEKEDYDISEVAKMIDRLALGPIKP